MGDQGFKLHLAILYQFQGNLNISAVTPGKEGMLVLDASWKKGLERFTGSL